MIAAGELEYAADAAGRLIALTENDGLREHDANN